MSSLKKFSLGLAVMGMLAIFMVPAVGRAATTSDMDNDSDDVTSTAITTDSSATSLGNLFLLDQLFNNGNGTLSNGNTNLGDLFLLNNLSNNNGDLLNLNLNANNNDLGRLLVLDGLFNNGNSNLGNLIVLNQLFH